MKTKNKIKTSRMKVFYASSEYLRNLKLKLKEIRKGYTPWEIQKISAKIFIKEGLE